MRLILRFCDRYFSRARFVPGCAVTLLMLAVANPSLLAQTETVLHSFTDNPDGAYPSGGLILKKGIFYGLTNQGGTSGVGGRGALFEVTPTGKEVVLYNFCTITLPFCADGANPNNATLIQDAKGNLYGSTGGGGAYGYGTVFEYSAAGVESVLYSFCALANCADGEAPRAAMVLDAQGNLYGVTQSGGTGDGNGSGGQNGTVFKVTPTGGETVLYNFCSKTNCTDGQSPFGNLVRDSQGNLYGTTSQGGDPSCDTSGAGCGTVFKITPSGKEIVLHTFTAGADSGHPWSGLVRDAKGNFYGSTIGEFDCGTVFKITAGGKYSILYTFAGVPDACSPRATLILDATGNLYGTTYGGGVNNTGTVFELSPIGKELVLYSFPLSGVDGQDQYEEGLVLDSKGNLYGTTESGGADGYGVVFKLVP